MAKQPNALISIPKFGKAKINVQRITQGLNIFTFGQPEPQGRHSKQFHTSHRTSGSFEILVVTTSWTQYNNLNRWFERYARWVSDANVEGRPARVLVPARNFDKTGILTSGISFGDVVGSATYRMELSFKGSRDPITDLRDSELLGQYIDREEQTYDPARGIRLLPAAYSEGTNSFDEVGNIDPADYKYLRGGSVF
ncbi:MAG: hypothetical protein R3330_13540 [Saprospiraceae bacterium]|nr:hypothetical protein [Saprospiraceae bacterium]